MGTVSNVVHANPSDNPSIRAPSVSGSLLPTFMIPHIAAAVEETVSHAGYDLVLATRSEDPSSAPDARGTGLPNTPAPAGKHIQGAGLQLSASHPWRGAQEGFV